MSIMLTFFIAIIVNLDNFFIGINLGICGQKLTIKSNCIIGSFTGLCSFLTASAAGMLKDNFGWYANYLGAVIMILFGIYCLIDGMLKKETYRTISIMTLKETCLLGLILAINCIPPSISTGMVGLSPVLMGICSAIFSFISMLIGNYLGEKLIQYQRFKCLIPISSILLIVIGVWGFF